MGRFWSKKEPESGPAPRGAVRVRPSRERPIQVQIMGRGSLDVLNARDISLTGLSIYVSHGFDGCDLEGEVQLVVTLPDTSAFIALGVVRHQTVRSEEPMGYFGVEFTELSDRNRARIRDYISGRAGH
ncbi:MAG: PilZ domain-containing protein [Proteobacteria bacterium]|nr:PilZ domain-containing protein [Pseudomonadota bacterium]